MGEPPWLYLNQRGSLSSAFLHQALLHDLFIQTIREVLEARIEMPSAGPSTLRTSPPRLTILDSANEKDAFAATLLETQDIANIALGHWHSPALRQTEVGFGLRSSDRPLERCNKGALEESFSLRSRSIDP